MEWVKTTAKTLPEAIDLALDNLGVDESEAEIVILEEPRPGLFGRMRGTARVEARVKPKPIRPKNERSRGRRNRSEGGGDGGGGRKGGRNRRKGGDRNDDRKGGKGRGGEGRGSDAGEQTRDGRRDQGGRDQGGGDGRGRRSRGRRDGADDEETTSSVAAEAAESTDTGPGSGRRGSGGGRGRGSGGGRGGQGSRRDRAESSGGEQAAQAADRAGTSAEEGASMDDVAAHLRTFLEDLTDAFGFESDVTIDDSDGEMLVGRIEGRHGLLVGPKGRTLDAVQELARISCQRAVPSSVRIKIDVGGYREQRAQALAEFARRAADKAVADGVEVALDPMSPADRKAVHDALNPDDRVETRSIGSEPRRRVLVVPMGDDEPSEVEDGDDAGSDEEE